MSDQHVVFGAFKTPAGAEQAVRRLESHDFAAADISVLMSESARNHFATIQANTKGPEGAAVGGITGGVLGAVLAGLTAAVTLSIPGIGLFAAGPLLAVIAGAGAGAAAGGVVGGLIGMGMTEHEARLYEAALKGGGVVVAVNARNKERASRAQEVFESSGALRVDNQRGMPADVAPPAQHY